jgi:hypothetical protein
MGHQASATDSRFQSNLFATLNKWTAVHRHDEERSKAAQRQDENFVTEAFVYVLRYLLWEPSRRATAAAVLNLLMKPKTFTSETCGKVVVIPHPKTDIEPGAAGIIFPDVELRDGKRHLTFVEVKVESPSPQSQYEKYKNALQVRRRQYETVSLVYVTREGKLPEGAVRPAEFEVHPVKWQEVWQALGQTEAAQDFLLSQFRDYLKGKGATFKNLKEAWQEEIGIEFTAVEKWLTAAFESNSLRKSKRAGDGDHRRFTWHGYYVSLVGEDKRQFSVGFDFARPTELIFTTLNLRIDTDKDLGDGEVFMWYGKFFKINEGIRWRRRVDLGPKFRMATDENARREVVNDFISTSLEQVRKFRA